jgi:Rad51
LHKTTIGEAWGRLDGRPVIGSGSGGLDTMLGGGFRAGRVVEIFGDSKSGKTQLAMQAAMYCANSGRKCLFLSSEGTFRPERVAEMAAERGWDQGAILDRIVYLRVSNSAEQVQTIRRMGARGETSDAALVAIDTVTHNFSLDFPGSKLLARRQGALDVHLSEICRDAFLGRRAYLLTNLVTFGDRGEEHIGGDTASQLVHDSVHLTSEEGRVKAQSDRTGMSARMQIGASGVV